MSSAPPLPAPPPSCGVCALHGDGAALADLLIHRDPLWILRHHPHPAPLPGWLVLDAVRHVGGPAGFSDGEAAGLGPILRRASLLVRRLTDCERVYAIAFGEGARHFHLHLIPRHGADPATESWRVADLYRAVAAGERQAADPAGVAALVARARALWAGE